MREWVLKGGLKRCADEYYPLLHHPTPLSPRPPSIVKHLREHRHHQLHGCLKLAEAADALDDWQYILRVRVENGREQRGGEYRFFREVAGSEALQDICVSRKGWGELATKVS